MDSKKYQLTSSPENDIRFLMYKEHMASTVAFAKDIVRFAFILNGAAGTALLAADKANTMKCSLACFGTGALLASVGAGFAYLYQYSVTMSWQKKILKHGSREVILYRNAAIGSLAMSLFCFLLGGIVFLL